jgi:hypothetical protein
MPDYDRRDLFRRSRREDGTIDLRDAWERRYPDVVLNDRGTMLLELSDSLDHPVKSRQAASVFIATLFAFGRVLP